MLSTVLRRVLLDDFFKLAVKATDVIKATVKRNIPASANSIVVFMYAEDKEKFNEFEVLFDACVNA